MRFIVILQARQGSTRLPGKSMRAIRGRPMLGYTIESILQSTVPADLYLATSSNPENDPLRALAAEYGIRALSGSESDVASRYVEILAREPDAAWFQRVCGDSPLYDHRLLGLGRAIAESERGLQVITSLPNRGYPQGMNLEMIERETYLAGYRAFASPAEFEHVTQFFYERLGDYRCRLVRCHIPAYEYPRYKFSVDTPDEFERMATLIGRLDEPAHSYPLEALCRLYDAVSSQRTAHKEAS